MSIFWWSSLLFFSFPRNFDLCFGPCLQAASRWCRVGIHLGLRIFITLFIDMGLQNNSGMLEVWSKYKYPCAIFWASHGYILRARRIRVARWAMSRFIISLNGPYLWTRDWTLAWRLVSQTRSIFLGWDCWDLTWEWSHISVTSFYFISWTEPLV